MTVKCEGAIGLIGRYDGGEVPVGDGEVIHEPGQSASRETAVVVAVVVCAGRCRRRGR